MLQLAPLLPHISIGSPQYLLVRQSDQCLNYSFFPPTERVLSTSQNLDAQNGAAISYFILGMETTCC